MSRLGKTLQQIINLLFSRNFDHRMKYTLNNKPVTNSQDVHRELHRKQHDKICPENFLTNFFPSAVISRCVAGFERMEPNKRYISLRSAELAHKIHLERLEKGMMDLEPFRAGFNAFGFGVAAMGIVVGIGVMAWGLGISAAVCSPQALKVLIT